MRATLLALAALLAGGCLSVPPRHGPCGEAESYEARAWPPSGTIVLRDVIATDVNADGATDLIVSSTADDNPDQWGYYVLLGPQRDPNALVYHAFVNTGVSPDAMTVADVLFTRSGCPDVTVFGEDPMRATGAIEIYEHVANERSGGWEMFAPTPAVTKDVGFLPENDGTPVMVTYGDFEGKGHERDLAVADLYQLRFFFTDDDLVSNLPSTPPRPVGSDATPNTPWSAINGIYPTPSLDGPEFLHDLIVVELEDLTWLRNDGNGNFTRETRVHSDDFTTMAPRLVDLDGIEPLDIAGAAGVGFGAYQIARNGGGVDIASLAWNQTLPVYNQLNDFAIGDLGGSPEPEVVALEVDEEGARPAFAMLVESLFVSGAELQPTAVSVHDFTNVAPQRLQITDFDGDGTAEVWAFDIIGNAVCLRRAAAGNALEPC